MDLLVLNYTSGKLGEFIVQSCKVSVSFIEFGAQFENKFSCFCLEVGTLLCFCVLGCFYSCASSCFCSFHCLFSSTNRQSNPDLLLDFLACVSRSPMVRQSGLLIQFNRR